MTSYFVGSELTRIPSAHSRSIGSREFSIEYIVVGFGHLRADWKKALASTRLTSFFRCYLELFSSCLRHLLVFLDHRNILAGKLLYIRILSFVRFALECFQILFMILNHRSHILTVELRTRELRETIDSFLLFSFQCRRNLHAFVGGKCFQFLISFAMIILHLPAERLDLIVYAFFSSDIF